VILYNHNDIVNEPRLVIWNLTLIGLAELTAKPKAGKVIISWRTESEIDNAGFNLYRSQSEEGEYIKINNFLMPAPHNNTGGLIRVC
jgi:hypothetical protein